MSSNGFYHAHVKDQQRVEGEPRDLEASRGGLAPREHDVGDESVREGLLNEGLHLQLDEVRCNAELPGGGIVGDVGEVLDAGGKTDLFGGEVDGVDADAVGGVVMIAAASDDGLVN
ncbi:hypothetical protein S245_029386 [Arachis hypogaea]|nr:uncharacterized protein DS421_9g264070 [Arachis hypogaea]